MTFHRFVLAGAAMASAAAALTGNAAAADMAVKAPALTAPIAAINWTGLYVGGHFGYVQSRARLGDPTTPGITASDTLKGFLAGGQIGFNYQMNSWVFGLEADLSGSNADASQTLVNTATNNADRATEKLRWMSLVTARAGYALDRALLYVKGGVAFGGFRFDAQDLVTGASASNSYSQAGWTVGAGVEYALNTNWSVRGEYSYVGFGNKTLTLVDSAGATTQVTVKQNVHQFKTGVNYRF